MFGIKGMHGMHDAEIAGNLVFGAFLTEFLKYPATDILKNLFLYSLNETVVVT